MSKMYIEILKSDTLDAIQRFSGAQYNLAPNNIDQEIHLRQSVGSNFTKPKSSDLNPKRNLSDIMAGYKAIEEDGLYEEGGPRKKQKIDLIQSVGSGNNQNNTSLHYGKTEQIIYTKKTLSPIEIPPK